MFSIKPVSMMPAVPPVSNEEGNRKHRRNDKNCKNCKKGGRKGDCYCGTDENKSDTTYHEFNFESRC